MENKYSTNSHNSQLIHLKSLSKKKNNNLKSYSQGLTNLNQLKSHYTNGLLTLKQ